MRVNVSKMTFSTFIWLHPKLMHLKPGITLYLVMDLGLMVEWLKALPLAARCLSPLPDFDSRPGHVKKLPLTLGWRLFSPGNIHNWSRPRGSTVGLWSQCLATKRESQVRVSTPSSQVGSPGRWINALRCGVLTMVNLRLKDSLELEWNLEKVNALGPGQ